MVNINEYHLNFIMIHGVQFFVDTLIKTETFVSIKRFSPSIESGYSNERQYR